MADLKVEVEEKGTGGYTQDGTVDLKGNPILRSKRGGWTACWFIVVYEVFERMAYFGIASNLFVYLTKVRHQNTVTAANDVTNWVGTIWMTPIIGAYVADALLGRYWTFIISSAIYLSGMFVLTLSVTIHALKPPQCLDPKGLSCKKPSTLQTAVFFGALYTLAVGTGGTKSNISTIGADQFDEYDPKEKSHKLSFFNWWLFSVFTGILFANTVLVWIQDNVGWGLGYGLPTIGLAISMAIFLAGTPFYRHKLPTGSPFTKMAQVIVASLRKWKLHVPRDPKELYELDIEYYTKNNNEIRIDSTPSMRFLNKACVKTSNESPWMLSPVTQVEETKQMLRMIPILITTFIPCTMIAQVNTLFVKQGTTLDRQIGNFQIPPASLAGFVTLTMLICVVLYDRVFVKIIRRWTKNPRGISLLQRMGIGMVIYIIIMVVASLSERHRLKVAKDHGVKENGKQVPLSIFLLLPQFLLMGIADAFFDVAKLELFYDQAPESMKSLGTSYTYTGLGAGNFISSFLLSTVSRITKRNGHEWVQNNLNVSHLDYYYAFLAGLNIFNFVIFLVIAKFYVYKAEVSDSMTVLRQELEASNTSVYHDEARQVDGRHKD